MGKKTVGRFVLDSTTPIAVAANSNIVFAGSTISTNALSYNSSTGEIQIKVPGLYRVYANFTVSAVGTETPIVTLLENGQAVPGAKASETLAAAENVANLAFSTVTTVSPSCGNTFATLSLRNIVATNYLVANVIVEKIA